jgi:hypothetical protein
LLLQFGDTLARFLRGLLFLGILAIEVGACLLQARQFLLQLSVACLRFLPIRLGLFVRCNDRRLLGA